MRRGTGFSMYSDVFASDILSQAQAIEGPDDLARVIADNNKKKKAQKLVDSKKTTKAVVRNDEDSSKKGALKSSEKPRGSHVVKDFVSRGTSRRVNDNHDTELTDGRYKRPNRGSRGRENSDRKSRMTKSSIKASSDRHGRSDIDWNDEVHAQEDFGNDEKVEKSTRPRGAGRGRYNNSRGFSRNQRDNQQDSRVGNGDFANDRATYVEEKFEDYENIEDEPLERLIVEATDEVDELETPEEGFKNTRRDIKPRGEGRRDFRGRGEGRQRGDNRGRREFSQRGEFRGRRDASYRGDSRRTGENRFRGERRDFEDREEGHDRQFREQRDYHERNEFEEVKNKEAKQFVFHEVDFPTMDQAYQ